MVPQLHVPCAMYMENCLPTFSELSLGTPNQCSLKATCGQYITQQETYICSQWPTPTYTNTYIATRPTHVGRTGRWMSGTVYTPIHFVCSWATLNIPKYTYSWLQYCSQPTYPLIRSKWTPWYDTKGSWVLCIRVLNTHYNSMMCCLKPTCSSSGEYRPR